MFNIKVEFLPKKRLMIVVDMLLKIHLIEKKNQQIYQLMDEVEAHTKLIQLMASH